MVIFGILLIALAAAGVAATALLGPRDGYGIARHGADDWPR
ncbi:hypothetical protein [Microbacterium indicum]|nr:hypothetical protein [Microbacterium indicum]